MDTDVENQEAHGDALEQKEGVEELRELKALADEIRTDVAEQVTTLRQTAAETRYCIWDGQSSDGRKHREDLGKDPVPYEGASDARVRYADKVVNERVAEYMLAVTRAARHVRPMDGLDNEVAGHLETLRRWIEAQWGDRKLAVVELLAQYMEGDSPGVAVAAVDWRREMGVELRELTAEELLGLWAQRQAQGEQPEEVTDEALRDVQDILSNPLREIEAAALLGALTEVEDRGALQKAARRLHLTGTARLAMRAPQMDGVEIEAMRLYRDVFMPANTTDPERARIWIRRRWLTRAEVLAESKQEGWAKKFTEELIGQGEGQKGHEADSWLDPWNDPQLGVEVNEQTRTLRNGLYEVLTSYSREATPDGAVGIFVRVWSYFCSVPAMPRRLWDRRHGKYPFVMFGAERLSDRVIDSRGVPERAVTDQNALKMLRDSVSDHVDKSVNPPVKKPQRAPKYQLGLQPHGEVEVGPRETIEYMAPPAYPRAAEWWAKDLRREANEYFGRPDPEVAGELVEMLRQARISRFLSKWGQVQKLGVQLALQYLPPARLARICGARAASQIATSREELRNLYDVEVAVDVRDWDVEYVTKKVKVLLENVRPMDVRGTLPWEEFARQTVAAVDVRLAELIPQAATAQERIRKDEEQAYLAILMGVRPPMPDWIENPEMRMDVLAELHEPRMQTPEAFPAVSPASAALMDERVKYLRFQAQQIENAATGRRGVALPAVGQLAAESMGA